MELIIDDHENLIAAPETDSHFEPDYLFDTEEDADE